MKTARHPDRTTNQHAVSIIVEGRPLSNPGSPALSWFERTTYGQLNRICVLALVAVFCAYIPLCLVRYAFADDYAMLIIHGFRMVNPFWIGDGRVLGGIVCNFLYSMFDTVSAASALRCIGIIHLIICLFLIQKALIAVGHEGAWAVLTAVLFAASPTVQNWVVWGVSAWQLPALILGIAAFFPGRLCIGLRGEVQAIHVFGFILLQLGSLLIYQPFATACWPLLLISVLNKDGEAFFWRRVVVLASAFALALIVGLLVTKVLIAVAIPPSGHDRTALLPLSHFLSRAYWFSSVPIPFVFSFVTDFPSPWIYVPTLTIVLIGLMVSGLSNGHLGRVFVLTMGTLLITAALVLVPEENTPVRTYVTLALFACVIFTFAIRMLLVSFNMNLWAIRVGVALTSLLLVVYSGQHVFRHTALAQAAELSTVEAILSKSSMPLDRPLVLLGGPEGTSLMMRGCEFVMIGCASSAVRFALPNMVRLWFREHGQAARPGEIFFARSPEDATVFSFEADRSSVVPMPRDPVFVDFRQAPLAAETR